MAKQPRPFQDDFAAEVARSLTAFTGEPIYAQIRADASVGDNTIRIALTKDGAGISVSKEILGDPMTMAERAQFLDEGRDGATGEILVFPGFYDGGASVAGNWEEMPPPTGGWPEMRLRFRVKVLSPTVVNSHALAGWFRTFVHNAHRIAQSNHNTLKVSLVVFSEDGLESSAFVPFKIYELVHPPAAAPPPAAGMAPAPVQQPVMVGDGYPPAPWWSAEERDAFAVRVSARNAAIVRSWVDVHAFIDTWRTMPSGRG